MDICNISSFSITTFSLDETIETLLFHKLEIGNANIMSVDLSLRQ